MMLRPSFAHGPRTALMFGALLALPALYAAACANSDNIIVNTGGAGGGGGGDTVCILHNCQSDPDCAACSESRHLCNTRSHLCVACNADTGEGCATEEYCSKFGYCVPTGLSCPSDDHGVPMITCSVSTECSACDATHRVCDAATSKCVACTQAETGACQHNETCTTDNTCQGTCPASCGVDPDCAGCNIAGQPAFYCAASKCVNMNGPPDGGSSSSSGSGAGGGANDGGTDGGPTGVCHPTCQVGPFMNPGCDSCAAAVCAADSFCCMTAWDTVCVSEVGKYCGAACGCPHPECTTGDPLPNNCSPCATKVCAADSFCCSVMWDMTCVGEVPGICGVTC